jgi:hypothetical protein
LSSDGKLRRRQLLKDSAAGAVVEAEEEAAGAAEGPGIRTRRFRRSSDRQEIQI